jgi:hypothetical protein
VVKTSGVPVVRFKRGECEEDTPGIAPTIATLPGGAGRRYRTIGTSFSPTASGVRRSSSTINNADDFAVHQDAQR